MATPSDQSRSAPSISGRRRRALFVDRDGTLNPDLHYLSDAGRLEVFRGVIDALRLVRAHGYLVLCVTNQSGVERGLYSDAQVHALHARLNEILEKGGTRVDAFYYCPHAPESNCLCRKPGVELFERAEREWHVDLSASAIIGDRGIDIQAGEKLGLLTVLVPAPGEEERVDEELKAKRIRPDLRASTFLGAALRVLAVG